MTMILAAVLAISAADGSAPVAATPERAPGENSRASITVRRAQACVAKQIDSCLDLGWIAGYGATDLRDIPPDLAAALERTLAPVCGAGNPIACDLQGAVLERLDRLDEVYALHRGLCLASRLQNRQSCGAQARLEERLGRPEEAVRILTSLCETESSDWDRSCRLAGELLERMAWPDQALPGYQRSCRDHGDNLSCDGVARLGGAKVPAGSWQGLYRSGNGTLLITDLGGGRIRSRQESDWANGHTCTYVGDGEVSGDVATMAAKKDHQGGVCQARLVKAGRTTEFQDPTGICRLLSRGVHGSLGGTFTRSP